MLFACSEPRAGTTCHVYAARMPRALGTSSLAACLVGTGLHAAAALQQQQGHKQDQRAQGPTPMVNTTVYRVSPLAYPGLMNMDTGGAHPCTLCPRVFRARAAVPSSGVSSLPRACGGRSGWRYRVRVVSLQQAAARS